MNTRKFILESVGHNVVLALGESSIVEACQRQRFDVAVIGQVITTGEKRRLMDLVRKHCPSAKVLELYPSYVGRVLEDADAWLEVPSKVPQSLAETVTALARL